MVATAQARPTIAPSIQTLMRAIKHLQESVSWMISRAIAQA
ncbi:hypothetical protein [Leptolyngbya sp. CCY15150]|nr:hypothetical protein [Leptolyngbya sp. CCY15150]